MNEQPLLIVRAAILDEYGGVHSVPVPGRHHDVIRQMRDSGYEGRLVEQGFLLNDGRFVRRKPAKNLAEKNGQLKTGRTISSVLTSEDLW